MTLLFGLLALSVIVAVHEFGHFAVARFFGVPVKTFSVGFGSRLFGFRLWGADFRVSSLPLGGYVSFQEKDGPHSVRGKPWYAQVLIALAGIFMNLVLAVVLFTAAYTVGGTYTHNDGTGVHIAQVAPEGPAARAGIKPGDTLSAMTINGRAFNPSSVEQVIATIDSSKGQPMLLRVRRGVTYQTLTVTPIPGPMGDGYRLGVILGGMTFQELSFPQAALAAVDTTWQMFSKGLTIVPSEIAYALGTGDGSRLSGPVGMLSAGAVQTQLGVLTMLFFMSNISIGLAVFNLLPMPPFDGWHVVRAIFEGVTKKTIPEKAGTWVTLAGLALIVALTVVIGISDVLKLSRA